MLKRIVVMIILLCCFSIVVCGCSSKTYPYSIISQDIYLAGELMKGASPRAVDVELVLNSSKIKDGTNIEYFYYGASYHGRIKSNGTIIWDSTPVMVADATYSSCIIENYNSSIKLTFYFNLQGLEVKIVQLFSEK